MTSLRVEEAPAPPEVPAPSVEDAAVVADPAPPEVSAGTVVLEPLPTGETTELP